MEFGVRLKNYGPWTTTKDAALVSEKNGFNSLWLNDHLLPPSGPMDVPFREAWTSLSALGAITNRAKLGTLVVCNSFRNPALIAKMASTLSSITNGRAILGIGAGWHKPEYDAYGYDFTSVRERMERLDEAARIIQMMLRTGKSTFQGKYYRVNDAPAIQVGEHKVPLWIGGGGPRLVRMAARLSDGWNCYRVKLDDFKTRYAAFEAEAKRKSRDPASLTVSMVTDGMVAKSKTMFEKLVSSAAKERGQTREQYKIPDTVVAGTSDEAAKTIRRLQAAGIQHLILNFPSVDLMEQLEYFGEEVIPQFSSGGD